MPIYGGFFLTVSNISIAYGLFLKLNRFAMDRANIFLHIWGSFERRKTMFLYMNGHGFRLILLSGGKSEGRKSPKAKEKRLFASGGAKRYENFLKLPTEDLFFYISYGLASAISISICNVPHAPHRRSKLSKIAEPEIGENITLFFQKQEYPGQAAPAFCTRFLQ
jgi:hypothetical protein